MFIVFSGKGSFGALFAKDTELFWKRKRGVSWLSDLDGKANIGSMSYGTFAQLCLPFLVCLLHGIRHFASFGGREEGADKGNWHRRSQCGWSDEGMEWIWWCAEGGVGKGVECAYEGGNRREAHLNPGGCWWRSCRLLFEGPKRSD